MILAMAQGLVFHLLVAVVTVIVTVGTFLHDVRKLVGDDDDSTSPLEQVML